MADNAPRRLLVKRRIDQYALQDALIGARLSAATRALLTRDFADERAAKATLAAFRNEMPTGGQDRLIIDELNEIVKDLRWSKSKKGRLILACNDEVPLLDAALRDAMGLKDLVIGAPAERLAVIVHGRVPSAEDKARVIERVSVSFNYPIVDLLKVE